MIVSETEKGGAEKAPAEPCRAPVEGDSNVVDFPSKPVVGDAPPPPTAA